MLDSIGYLYVWNRSSANFLSACRSRILDTLRRILGARDLELAAVSSRIPHYSSLVNSHFGAKFYLAKNLPFYLVTCIVQSRLNYSIIYNRGKWHNLGMFDSVSCRFCGELDSFPHLFICAHTSSLLPLIAQQDPPSYILSLVNNKDSSFKDFKNLYLFVTRALQLRSN